MRINPIIASEAPRSSQDAATMAIRLHLVARGKKQTWLAGEIGESSFWLSRRMTGAIIWDVNDLDRIATIFGTTLEHLLADSEAVPA